MKRARFLLGCLVAVAACNAGGFEPASSLESVRILGAKSSKPYAKPGEDVDVEVLAYDGRVAKGEPMRVSWIPFVCKNPFNDLYYACFATLAGGAAPPTSGGQQGGGGGGAIAGLLKPGTSLDGLLVEGNKFHFTMPADAVTSHPPVQGATAPYGMAVVFNVACAGHLEVVERDPKNPVSPPFGCFDKDGKQLGADDFAIGFTRVYAYDERVNANPVVTTALRDGKPIDLRDGIIVDHCTADDEKDCPKTKLDVDVPPTSYEINDGDVDPNGVVRHELLWASWFTTTGELVKNEAELLYEPRSGRIQGGNEAELRLPQVAGDGLVFVVVHDNRGGAAWLEIPLHVR